jgi:hypothetical protein
MRGIDYSPWMGLTSSAGHMNAAVQSYAQTMNNEFSLGEPAMCDHIDKSSQLIGRNNNYEANAEIHYRHVNNKRSTFVIKVGISNA